MNELKQFIVEAMSNWQEGEGINLPEPLLLTAFDHCVRNHRVITSPQARQWFDSWLDMLYFDLDSALPRSVHLDFLRQWEALWLQSYLVSA